MRSSLVAGMLLVAALGVATTTTLALFTDSDSVAANTFSTGTVVLSTSPTSAVVTFSTMAPGDQVTASLTVTNGRTLAFRYAVTSSTTANTLAAQLDLTIKVGVTTVQTVASGPTEAWSTPPATLDLQQA